MSTDLSFIRTRHSEFVEINEKGFKYLDWMHGTHQKRRFRVWLSRDVQTDYEDQFLGEIANFPLEDSGVDITQKGTFVLRFVPDFITYLVSIKSGYRGSAWIEDIRGARLLKEWKVFHSPLGNLGETHWAIYFAERDNPVQIKWHRTGRHVEQTSGWVEISPTGEKEELLNDEEALSLLF